MKLLLAEDEPAMAEAVKDVLEYHRYQVDAVYNGVDALDYIHAGSYDGIILDIMMPGMSGLEVLTRIRKEGCRTPVLLLTAKTQIGGAPGENKGNTPAQGGISAGPQRIRRPCPGQRKFGAVL